MRALNAIVRLLFRPVDIAGLVALRVLFGALMAWDTARFVASGWVDSSFIEPALLFKYLGFTWVGLLPRPLLYAVFGIMVASSVCIALGLYYRLSCLLFFLGHSYIFLVASSYYLNHAYLISLFTLLLMVVPAHRALSLDAHRDPELHSRMIPAWPLWLLKGTLMIVFIYGGVAKLNADWFAGEPVRHWLAHRAASSVVGDVLRHETTIQLVCIGGALFDLLIGPALLWRRTRVLAALASLGFHLSNAYLFNIGVFPWFMLAATTLFFDPRWPIKLLPQLDDYLNDTDLADRDSTAADAADSDPAELNAASGEEVAGEERLVAELAASRERPEHHALDVPAATARRIAWAWCAVMLLQVLIPLRHHLYPGDVAWTEEGHYFSWRMKLRHKDGRATFRVTAPDSGAKWTVDPAGQLTERQLRKLPGRPDMLLQYAHYLRDAYKRDTGEDVEVRADVFLTLNYRAEQRYVDPDIDLAKEPFSLGSSRWLLPFEDTPLPSPATPLDAGFGPLAARIKPLRAAPRLPRKLFHGPRGPLLEAER